MIGPIPAYEPIACVHRLDINDCRILDTLLIIKT